MVTRYFGYILFVCMEYTVWCFVDLLRVSVDTLFLSLGRLGFRLALFGQPLNHFGAPSLAMKVACPGDHPSLRPDAGDRADPEDGSPCLCSADNSRGSAYHSTPFRPDAGVQACERHDLHVPLCAPASKMVDASGCDPHRMTLR